MVEWFLARTDKLVFPVVVDLNDAHTLLVCAQDTARLSDADPLPSQRWRLLQDRLASEITSAAGDAAHIMRPYEIAVVTAAAFLTAEAIRLDGLVDDLQNDLVRRDAQRKIGTTGARAQCVAHQLLAEVSAPPARTPVLIALGRWLSVVPPTSVRPYPTMPRAMFGAASGPRHRRSTRWADNTHPVVLVLALLPVIAAVLTALYLVVGMAPAPGRDLVVLVTASTAEPAPSVSRRVSSMIRDSADRDFSDIAVFDPDGRVDRSVDLEAVDDPPTVDQVVDGWSATVTSTPRRQAFDLLSGMRTAVRDREPGTLVVISSGLSTKGGFDLRRFGWEQSPGQIAERLRAANALPNLTDWRVVFSGLGDTAGLQPPLPDLTRNTLSAYWAEICRTAKAAACDVDGNTGAAATWPQLASIGAVVPIPGVDLTPGPGGRITLVYSTPLLFASGSSGLTAAGQRLVSDTAVRITSSTTSARAGSAVQVIAHVARVGPPGSGSDDVARDRALAVQEALRATGMTRPIEVRVSRAGTDAPGSLSITY